MPNSKPADKKYVILVAEDEEGIREILSMRLIKAGFEVKEAADGNLAFQLLAQRCVDAVLCDVRMPTCDGITLLKRARGVLGLKIPFAFVSADTSQNAEDLLKLSSQAVFSKPFNFNDIEMWLKNALTGQAKDISAFSPFYVSVGLVDSQRAFQGGRFVARVEEVSDLQLKLTMPVRNIKIGQEIFVSEHGDSAVPENIMASLGVFGSVRQVEMSGDQMKLTVYLSAA